MQQYLPLLLIAALVGAGLMSGLLFVFSNVVMRALLELPPAHGMHAMQRINIVIVNPLFLLIFVGTAVACVGIVVIAASAIAAPGMSWCLAGALAYLLGPVGVTAAFNIPLNNRLASRMPDEAPAQWPAYAVRWLRWNHVRTVLAVLAVVCLAVGVGEVGMPRRA